MYSLVPFSWWDGCGGQGVLGWALHPPTRSPRFKGDPHLDTPFEAVWDTGLRPRRH